MPYNFHENQRCLLYSWGSDRASSGLSHWWTRTRPFGRYHCDGTWNQPICLIFVHLFACFGTTIPPSAQIHKILLKVVIFGFFPLIFSDKFLSRIKITLKAIICSWYTDRNSFFLRKVHFFNTSISNKWWSMGSTEWSSFLIFFISLSGCSCFR